MRFLEHIMFFIFISFFLIFLIYSNLNKPRIFIVHSYDLKYTWVQGIKKGIEKYLNNYHYLVRWYYMDTKRHPDSEFIKKAGYNARKIIEEWNPDILILVDDNAQTEVGVYYLNHPSIKILYTGLNGKLSDYGYDKAENITGMIERIPFYAFKEIFLQILPSNKRKILHISDNSVTSKGVYHELEEVEWSPLELIETLRIDSYSKWKDIVLKAHEYADIVLITHYHTIRYSEKNKKIVPSAEVLKWTVDNLKIPSIGAWGFFVEEGGMMAVAVSPFEQGEFVAQVAIRILEKKEDIRSISPKVGQFYLIYIREKELEKYNLLLPSVHEAFARATNSFFE